MPTYNPKDMAYVLQMSKTGSAYTPEELALMQDINRSVAGGAMTGMPAQAGAALTAGEMQRMAQMPQVAPQSPMGQPAPMPMNRLASIQAAANRILGGAATTPGEQGQNMANIAKYFQGQ